MSKKGRKTDVRRLDGIPVPRNAKHSIAAGFRNERVRTLLARFGRENVLNTPVAPKASGDACVYTISVLNEVSEERNYRPCNGVPSVVYIIASHPGSNSTGSTLAYNEGCNTWIDLHWTRS